MAARHALERSELEAALKQALQALSAAKQDHAAALLEHEQASQRTEQQHRASLDALNAQHTAALQRRDREQQAALRQHREQLLQTQVVHLPSAPLHLYLLHFSLALHDYLLLS